MDLPDNPTRDELEALIIQRATNDAAIWALLVDPATTDAGLEAVFGAPPPPGVNVTVVAESPTTFYHVIPGPEEAVQTAGPPTIAPRVSFQRRLNYLLHADPAFKAEFEAFPPAAISKAFQFRFPSHVTVVPLAESSTTGMVGDPSYSLYIVLPYAAHEALFNAPYAIAFNGADQWVTIPFSPSLDFHDAISVEAWFKASSYDSGNWQDAVVSMHGPAAGWELRVGGRVPRFLITIGGVHYYAQPHDPTPFLQPDRWYYLVGSYDGDQLQLHLDGKLLYTTFVRGPMTVFQGPMTIGRNSYDGWNGRFFAGEVDEVRVWSRAVSAGEIQQYRPKKRLGPLPDPDDPSLRAYYPTDEGNGTVLHDRSMHGNNGTLIQAQWATIPENAP